MPTGEFIGPLRIWRPSLDCPGLMMSRSFGDTIAHQYGVICIPGNPISIYFFTLEVKIYEKTEHHIALILASDGIWEHITPQSVPKICLEHIKVQLLNDRIAENFADSLMSKAISEWRKVKYLY